MPRFAALLVATLILVIPAGQAFAQARPATNPIEVKLANGVLVNAKGFTLYHLLQENTGHAHCTKANGCTAVWLPLLLPNGATAPKGGTGVTDKLGFVTRTGIGRQITYDGWLLYRFTGDTAPGQKTGNVSDSWGKWADLPAAPKVTFSISITATPIVWGTVTTTYSYHGHTLKSSCSQASCTVSVHAGVNVTLRETPTSEASWPWVNWTLTAKHGGVNKTVSSTSTVLKAADDFSVDANYRPA